MQVFLQILRGITVLILGLWAILVALGNVNRVAQVIEDPSPTVRLIQEGAQWLFSTPPWTAALVAFFATVLLFWPTIERIFKGHFQSGLPSTRAASNEINLHEFFRYIGIDPMDRSTPSSNRAHEACIKLRQLARDNKITIIGAPGFKYASHYISLKPREQIQPIYWRDASVFCLDVLGAKDTDKISTMPDDALGGNQSEHPVYKKLSIIESGMMRHFKANEFAE
jgi:hypothetical protein